MNTGNSLRVVPATGPIEVLSTWDDKVSDHTTAIFNVTSDSTWTDILDATGNRLTPTFLSTANNGSTPNKFRLEHQNSDSGGVWTPICDILLPPGAPIYYPLVGSLGLDAGDKLRARGKWYGRSVNP